MTRAWRWLCDLATSATAFVLLLTLLGVSLFRKITTGESDWTAEE